MITESKVIKLFYMAVDAASPIFYFVKVLMR